MKYNVSQIHIIMNVGSEIKAVTFYLFVHWTKQKKPQVYNETTIFNSTIRKLCIMMLQQLKVSDLRLVDSINLKAEDNFRMKMGYSCLCSQVNLEGEEDKNKFNLMYRVQGTYSYWLLTSCHCDMKSGKVYTICIQRLKCFWIYLSLPHPIFSIH